MVNRRQVRHALILGAAWVLTAPTAGYAHPLHTTFTELSHDQRTGILTASVKVFADDFVRRITRNTRVNPGDDAVLQRLAFNYLAATLKITGRPGEQGSWQWCGWKRSADLIFACMRTRLSPAAIRVSDSILCDVFADQVNIVQASLTGKRQTLLFTAGDGEKALE